MLAGLVYVILQLLPNHRIKKMKTCCCAALQDTKTMIINEVIIDISKPVGTCENEGFEVSAKIGKSWICSL